MRFAELQPFAAHSPTVPGAFEVNFNCPGCGIRTVIHVSQWPPHIYADADTRTPVWKFESSGEFPDWNNITIEPSLQDVPHPQTSTCRFRNFSVTKGEVIGPL